MTGRTLAASIALDGGGSACVRARFGTNACDGNGPAALEARRAPRGKPPGLIAHERHRAEEERSPAPYNQKWLDR